MPTFTPADDALDTLLLPLLQGHLDWPGRGLFLGARTGQSLLQAGFSGLVCEQTFKPDAEALQSAGLQLTGEADSQRHPIVLVLPPRQREAGRALLARAVSLLEPGGIVMSAAPNVEGARSQEADLARLVGPLSSLSKHKCRVFWSAPFTAADPQLLAQWLTLDAVQPIAEGRFLSRPGLFAWDRIDIGSALLAEHLPATLRGKAADLGAGFGYLSAELLRRCPGITALDLYEAEQRALDLARSNLAEFAPRAKLEYHWHDVTRGLQQRYDTIICNPPFHEAGRSRAELGRSFITVAARALRPGGSFWLVANRQLAYEQVLADQFAQLRTVVQRHGFKVIQGVVGR